MDKLLTIIKSPWLYVCLIVVLGFGVRLYKLDNPVADWHSWRQADTAAVARNFYKEGFNPFIPRYDNMLGESGRLSNPERYRFVEFPLYNSLIYFAYLLNGGVDEKLARLISVFMSLGSIIFLFLIVRRYWGIFTALLSAFTFATLPFNIYFSRVILPEPTLVFLSLGMFYFTDRWIYEDNFKIYLTSVLFAAAAFLIKPMAIFYLLPLVYSYYQKEKKWWPIPKRYYLWIILAITPFIAWRVWMSRFPEGIPQSGWLLNSNGIRFRPAFWRWIVGDRLGREILTVTGMTLFSFGVLLKPLVKEGWLLHLFIASSLLYVAVFATGNVQHDYYQVLIVPALVMGLSRGFTFLLRGIEGFLPRLWTIPVAILFFVLTFYLGWLEIKGLYQINNWAIVEAGQAADKLLPKDALVIAPYGGDTAFLYQVNRPGFPILPYPIKEMKEKFAVSYYISVSFDEDTKQVMQKYTPILINPNFVIVDLTKENLSY